MLVMCICYVRLVTYSEVQGVYAWDYCVIDEPLLRNTYKFLPFL